MHQHNPLLFYHPVSANVAIFDMHVAYFCIEDCHVAIASRNDA